VEVPPASGGPRRGQSRSHDAPGAPGPASSSPDEVAADGSVDPAVRGPAPLVASREAGPVRDSRETLRFLAAPTDAGYAGTVGGSAGRRVMEWIDKAGYVCAVGSSGSHCVTAYVGNVSFTRPVPQWRPTTEEESALRDEGPAARASAPTRPTPAGSASISRCGSATSWRSRPGCCTRARRACTSAGTSGPVTRPRPSPSGSPPTPSPCSSRSTGRVGRGRRVPGCRCRRRTRCWTPRPRAGRPAGQQAGHRVTPASTASGPAGPGTPCRRCRPARPRTGRGGSRGDAGTRSSARSPTTGPAPCRCSTR
jgi:hypothetical protein